MGEEVAVQSINYWKEYQVLISSGVTLLICFITLLVNHCLSRKQHERTINQEANSLRKVIVEEINYIVLLLKESENFRRRDNSNSIKSQLFINTIDSSIYKSSLNKLGYLNSDEVKSVITSYCSLAIYKNTINGGELQTSTPIPEGFVAVNDHLIKTATTIMEKTLNSFKDSKSLLDANITN